MLEVASFIKLYIPYYSKIPVKTIMKKIGCDYSGFSKYRKLLLYSANIF